MLSNRKRSAIILVVLYGEIAQLARAFGSYPKGRGFDPPSRYQNDKKLGLKKSEFLMIDIHSYLNSKKEEFCLNF